MKTMSKKTLDDYFARPEEFGVELIEGEFVMSASATPRHQMFCTQLLTSLHLYTQRSKNGKVMASLDVILADDLVLQPDTQFISKDRYSIIKDRIYGAPDVAVEALSPGTADRDRFVKKALYARYGVREYWIVDLDVRTIEVFTLNGHRFESMAIFEEHDKLSTPLMPDLDLDLSTLWE